MNQAVLPILCSVLLGAGTTAEADVRFVINPQQDVHPISRFIYGINQPIEGNYADLAFTRVGGNRWTAYNWENNASNAGSDWNFQNDAYLGGSDTPGGAVINALQKAAAHNAGILLTIPINGYVAADKKGDGDVRNSGSNYLQTRFRRGIAEKGSDFALTPDPNDGFVYQDEFVHWVNTNYPYGQTDPKRPIFFGLDNEPDLWASTHAEVHPAAITYAELLQKTTDYAAAIKQVVPSATVFGPVNYGWYGYVTLQDAPDAAGRDFLDFYLYQLALAELSRGFRLIDVLDVHWYPEAQGGGTRITEQNNTAGVIAARLQAPRSLWDPAYTETSWITQWSTFGPIALVPRLKDKIATQYPGTKLAITEYNYGGGNHISGGIAQADVLGIFGREALFAANEWPLAADESFIAGGFRMFRNFDGLGSHFGDTSVRATTSDNAGTSVYASTDTAHPDRLVVVALNKTAQPVTARMEMSGIQPNATANVYQLTSASPLPKTAGSIAIPDPMSFAYTLPAYSVSTFSIAGTQGGNTAPSVNTPASATPNPVTGTTATLNALGNDDGGESGLTYVWAASGTAPVTFSENGTNAAKRTVATFGAAGNYALQVTISDGALRTSSTVSVTVQATVGSIAVNPAQVNLAAGAAQQFSATASDQFAKPLSPSPMFTWSVVSGPGTISSSGKYSAPSTTGTALVQAASAGTVGTARVDIVSPAVPTSPTSLSAKALSGNQIQVTWSDRSSNETGFAVESSTDSRTYRAAGTVGANVRSLTASGLAARTKYYFRVRAYNAGGYSAYSNVASATTNRR